MTDQSLFMMGNALKCCHMTRFMVITSISFKKGIILVRSNNEKNNLKQKNDLYLS